MTQVTGDPNFLLSIVVFLLDNVTLNRTLIATTVKQANNDFYVRIIQ